ncbi:hypothetical protein FGB62_303g06 [Gracilaria domingensis]|nr:hypothetical protein FGB62_303g06 [Gracilaria domingensis]
MPAAAQGSRLRRCRRACHRTVLCHAAAAAPATAPATAHRSPPHRQHCDQVDRCDGQITTAVGTASTALSCINNGDEAVKSAQGRSGVRKQRLRGRYAKRGSLYASVAATLWDFMCEVHLSKLRTERKHLSIQDAAVDETSLSSPSAPFLRYNILQIKPNIAPYCQKPWISSFPYNLNTISVPPC